MLRLCYFVNGPMMFQLLVDQNSVNNLIAKFEVMAIPNCNFLSSIECHYFCIQNLHPLPTLYNSNVLTNDCSKWDDFTIKNVVKNVVSFSAQKQAQQNSDPNVQ